MPAEDVTVEHELSACPFCNWPAKLHDQDGVAWVECIDCACEGPPEDTAAAAIAAWNTRHQHSASTPSGDGECEKVEAAIYRFRFTARGTGDREQCIPIKHVSRLANDVLAALSPRPLPTREEVAQAVLHEARENGADSPIDYGDAEQIADAILALLRGEKA